MDGLISGHSRCGQPIRCRSVLLIIAICLSTVPSSSADDLVNLLNKRGNLALRETSLNEAVFAIRESWGVNIVVGKNVEGTVNGVFENTPLHEVLDAVLLANGFGYQRSGSSLVILPLQDVGVSNPFFTTSVIPIRNGNLDEILTAVSAFKSPQGKVQTIKSSNSLVVIDSPAVINRIRQFIEQIHRSQSVDRLPDGAVTSTQIADGVVQINPQFIDVSQLEQPLTDVLASRVKIALMPEENRMLVIGDSESISLAKTIVAELDQPRTQVRITAYIYDISLSEIEKLGVNWSQRIKGASTDWIDVNGGLLNARTTGDLAATAGSLAAGATPNQLALQTLNKHFDLHSVVQALDETKGARLLADPSVTVVDREQASIRIVTRVPVQELTQTEAGGNIGTTTFEEAGITLTVTPFISNDGTIQLQVSPTFSVLAGFQNNQPIIDTREANTVVRVANGQTLVIGGLRQRTEVETVRGVPHVMNWPIVGRLFRDHGTEIRESELIVFIQPQIVSCGCGNSAREQAACEMCKLALDRIPHAEDVQFIPTCQDKSCPYHCPRPRINGGSRDLEHEYRPDEFLPDEYLQNGYLPNEYLPNDDAENVLEGRPMSKPPQGPSQTPNDNSVQRVRINSPTDVPPKPRQFNTVRASFLQPYGAKPERRGSGFVDFSNWFETRNTWESDVMPRRIEAATKSKSRLR